MIERAVTGNGLVADFFHDGSGQPRKAIILLGGSEGGKFWSRPKQLLQHLVKRGYNLLSLAYFKAPGLPRSLKEIPLEYFERAFSWLAAQPVVVPDEYALIGASKGAEAALLLASRYAAARAVVGYSPSHVVWQGIPRNRFVSGQELRSSWSYQGKGLPFVSTPFSRRDFWALLTLRLRHLGEEALQNTEHLQEASIPVENTQGAIMLISSRRDQLWPSTYMCEQIVGRLEANGFLHHYEHIALDRGHGGVIRDRECWRKVFAFLEEHFA
jgi:fermentation-respiration switch protein FrsA (DUF1100 family)